MPRFTIETELEAESARWIAEVPEVCALHYGATREEAAKKALAVALRFLADRLECGEATPEDLALLAVVAAA